MSEHAQQEMTQLLLDWGRGNKAALDRLVPLVYAELRRLARKYMRGERQGHSMQTTALVNEAYIRLIDYKQMRWQDRAHFFAVAAQLMRRILVEQARSRNYAKRGGGNLRKVAIEEAEGISNQPDADIVAIDDALQSLANIDPRKSQIVELKFFGGLSIEETAEVMSLSTATVERELRSAKAWLFQALNKKEEHGS